MSAWDYTSPEGNVHRQQVCLGLREGGLAQLARALAWHARGHRFDPDILHYTLLGERSLTY